MTTVSQDANLPNCILSQLTAPAVIAFSNSFNQLYKNSTITGFQDVGFWELESHSSYVAIQPNITLIKSIGNDVAIAVSQTNKWILAVEAVTSDFYVRSTDGANTWASLTAPATPTSWEFVGNGNGVWILCEDTGTFWTSTSSDAGSWTVNAYTFPDGGFIKAGRFRDGEWIIISSLGDIARSTDGTTWTTVDSTIFTAGQDVEFSFITSDWMAVGTAGGVGRAAISTDEGVTWALASGLLANCTSALTVEYHRNSWFVGGVASTGLGLWRSTDDGVNWTQFTSASTGLPVNGQIQSLDIVGNILIAMSITDAQLYFSRDGINWFQFQLGAFDFN